MQRAKRMEVAKLAGVSEATVSFVFSKKRYVSQELTDRVLDAARELDYQPDMIARSMVMKTTKTIAVLTSDIASPLQMEVIKGIQSAAMEAGFFVNICGGTTNLERYVDNFISRRVDGVFVSVISSLVRDAYLKKLLDRDIGVIITSMRNICDDRICGLEIDFVYGIKLIVEHLKSLGHRKIAYLSYCDDDYADDRRLKGFRSVMHELFGGENPLVVMGTPPYDSTTETGFELANRLLAKTRDFTAVVCSNDLMAFGAIRALGDAGFKVPQDVSVVGIDDIVFSKVYNPRLTTLSHASEEYGERIFDILYDNIRDKAAVRREIVKPKLIVRDSTGPVRE